MHIFNSIFSKIFDLLFVPFRNLSPWISMALISLLTGLLMLLIFRYTSNQQGIRRVKNKIKAHLLEMRLYKDNLSISLQAQGNIFLANMRYLSYSLKPLLVMIIPLVLILIQLNFWFYYKSLAPGETAILKTTLKESYNPLDVAFKIEPSSGITIDTPPLRIEEENEIAWRITAKEAGIHSLNIQIEGTTYSKTVAVAQKGLFKISPLRVQRTFIDEMMNPVEPPLPGDSPLKSIEITYSSKKMNLFGFHIHWLIAYFILSIIFGFALKGILKVEI